MVIEPAKGKKGFLLYSHVTEKHFFRVYDSLVFGTYKDYDLCAEDIEVEILDQHLELYEGENNNRLDYSRKILENREASS